MGVWKDWILIEKEAHFEITFILKICLSFDLPAFE